MPYSTAPADHRPQRDADPDAGRLDGLLTGRTELDRSHGRIIRRSIWVADTGGIDFPQARRVARILLHLAGVKEITRTLQAIGRDRIRILDYLPL